MLKWSIGWCSILQFMRVIIFWCVKIIKIILLFSFIFHHTRCRNISISLLPILLTLSVLTHTYPLAQQVPICNENIIFRNVFCEIVNYPSSQTIIYTLFLNHINFLFYIGCDNFIAWRTVHYLIVEFYKWNYMNTSKNAECDINWYSNNTIIISHFNA